MRKNYYRVVDNNIIAGVYSYSGVHEKLDNISFSHTDGSTVKSHIVKRS